MNNNKRSKKVARLAIIGIGKWGKNLVREFKKIEDESGMCEVIAIVNSGNKENRKFVREIYPKVKFLSFEEVLINEHINAVVIATPAQTHFELAKKALEYGKHVYLEKPPTESSIQTRQLIELARRTKVVLFINNIYLYHPLIIKLAELVRNKKVFSITFDWIKEGPFSTNIFQDLVYHDIYILINLFGDIKRVKIDSIINVIKGGDLVKLRVSMRDGLRAYVNINRLIPVKSKTITVVTDKNCYIWTDRILYKIDQKNLKATQVELLNDSPLGIVCQRFTKNVLKNVNEEENFLITLKTMRIIESLVKKTYL